MLNKIIKGPGLVIILICLSFTVGYTEENFWQWWNTPQEKPQEVEQPAEVLQPAPPPKPLKKSAASGSPAPMPYTSPAFSGFNANGNSSKKMIPPPQASMSPVSRARNNPSLKSTLNSVKRGEIDDNQVIRRNAYFEKLSKQMRELKGEESSSDKKESPDNSLNEAEQVVAEDGLPEDLPPEQIIEEIPPEIGNSPELEPAFEEFIGDDPNMLSGEIFDDPGMAAGLEEGLP